MITEEDLYFPEGVDSTMLSAYQSCPQKWLLEFCLRRAPVGRSIDLHAGGAMAKAFEVFRIAYYQDQLSHDDSLIRAHKAFIFAWGDMPSKEGSYKDFINCWSAVEAYFQEYPPATDYFQPWIKGDGAPAVEFRFAIPTRVLHPITNNPILFTGRADQLSTNHPDSCYVQDEKTTKALGTSWYYQWDMRGQFLGYTYAARHMGFPCAGALVRGIAIQQTQFGFAEKVLLYTDSQLEDWWVTINDRLERMVYDYLLARVNLSQEQLSDYDRFKGVHRSFHKSYGDACASYGGCAYRDLCQADEPWIYYNSMPKRIWNPLAQDPTEESEDPYRHMETMTLQQLMGE